MQPHCHGHGWRLNKHVDSKKTLNQIETTAFCWFRLHSCIMCLGALPLLFVHWQEQGSRSERSYPDLYEWTIKEHVWIEMFELWCEAAVDLKIKTYLTVSHRLLWNKMKTEWMKMILCLNGFVMFLALFQWTKCFFFFFLFILFFLVNKQILDKNSHWVL